MAVYSGIRCRSGLRQSLEPDSALTFGPMVLLRPRDARTSEHESKAQETGRKIVFKGWKYETRGR